MHVVAVTVLPLGFCSHTLPSPTRSHARACEYNCAKRDYGRNREERRGPAGSIAPEDSRNIMRVRLQRSFSFPLSLSFSLSLSKLLRALDLCSRYRARGRTIDTVIYCSCAMRRSRVIYKAANLSQRWAFASLANDSSGNSGPLSAKRTRPVLVIHTSQRRSRPLGNLISDWRLRGLICIVSEFT